MRIPEDRKVSAPVHRGHSSPRLYKRLAAPTDRKGPLLVRRRTTANKGRRSSPYRTQGVETIDEDYAYSDEEPRLPHATKLDIGMIDISGVDPSTTQSFMIEKTIELMGRHDDGAIDTVMRLVPDNEPTILNPQEVQTELDPYFTSDTTEFMSALRRFVRNASKLPDDHPLVDETYKRGFSCPPDSNLVVFGLHADVAQIHIYKDSLSKLVDLGSSEEDTSSCSPWSDSGYLWRENLQEYTLKWSSWDIVTSLVNWRTVKDELTHMFDTYPYPMVADTKHLPNITETIDAVRTVMFSTVLMEQLLDLDKSRAPLLVDLLDQLLDEATVRQDVRLYTKIRDIAQVLCTRHEVLPSSCSFKATSLNVLHEQPASAAGFADIWEARLGPNGNGVHVALKTLRVYGDHSQRVMFKKVCKEAIIWKHIQHKNVVPLIGVDTTVFPLSLVSPWMGNGDIRTFVGRHPEVDRLNLLIGVAQGLQYLHSIDIVHGDLKGTNILIDDQMTPHLAGFDLSSIRHDPDLDAADTAHLSNVRWLAPELLDPESVGLVHPHPTPATDVYAMSMVIWEVLTGLIPFHPLQNDAQVVYSIVMGKRPERTPEMTAHGLSDNVWSLMQICWSQDVQKRPDADHVVQSLECSGNSIM